MKKIIISFIFIVIFSSGLYSQVAPHTNEFRIDDLKLGNKDKPKITSLRNNRFVVCWENYYPGQIWCLRAQLFDSTLNKIGVEFYANSDRTLEPIHQAITSLPDGRFVISWSYHLFDPNSRYDLYGQIFDNDGNKNGPEFPICTSKNFDQFGSQLTSLPSGGFVVCWESRSHDRDSSDIFFQMYDSDGNEFGAKYQISNDSHQELRSPSIASLPNGDFVVCWLNYNENNSIYYQIFDSLGSRKGSEFKVTTYSYDNYTPQILALSDDKFFIQWGDRRYSGDIFGLIINSQGDKIVDEFMINTYGGHFAHTLTLLEDRRIIVCWDNKKFLGKIYDIFAQMFDAFGNRIGTESLVNSNTSGWQFYPSICSFMNNGFIVCWSYYDSDGFPDGIIGKYFPKPQIHQLSQYSLINPTNDQTLSTIRPIFSWEQPSILNEYFPWEVSFDLYIDTNQDYSNPQIIKDIQDTTYTVDSLKAGQTYFWKVLAKNLDGDSLWSKQQDWGFFISPNATSVATAEQKLPMDFELFQNYPNPFNSSTYIKYFLPNVKASYQVQLRIYDVLGRSVKVLVDQEQSAGSYAISWDGTDLGGNRVASGVYFYHFETGHLKSIRKMLMLQ